MNELSGVIGAPAVCTALVGVGNAGAGIKVAVIDTVIDQDHLFINDPSLNPPAGFPKFDPGNRAFTNHKVIVARVYFTPNEGTVFTPRGLQDHGTHVSGTIAGLTHTTAPANGKIPSLS